MNRCEQGCANRAVWLGGSDGGGGAEHPPELLGVGGCAPPLMRQKHFLQFCKRARTCDMWQVGSKQKLLLHSATEKRVFA